ncbi:MAG: hypothetical protein ACKVRN_08690 [Pyrinomonadaceae bacterium]
MTTAEGQILARWHGSIENPFCSPLEFLQMVEQEIIEKDFSNISRSYITRREGGWFTSRRVYLRIQGFGLFFDTSATVEGNSLVVSWWLHREQPDMVDLFSELPVLGYFLSKTIRAETYYAVDIIEHFQHSIHESIVEVFKRLGEQNGEFLPDSQQVWEEIW